MTPVFANAAADDDAQEKLKEAMKKLKENLPDKEQLKKLQEKMPSTDEMQQKVKDIQENLAKPDAKNNAEGDSVISKLVFVAFVMTFWA